MRATAIQHNKTGAKSERAKMDNFSPIGNWADEPLDSPPISQGNSPKKENSGGKKRHSSIKREPYRLHSDDGGGAAAIEERHGGGKPRCRRRRPA